MSGKRFRQTAKLALSLDFVTKISQHNHFRYFRPFRLNVSWESNKTNVSLLANDTTYPMTFSAHLPMNLAISGLSSAQLYRKETKQLLTKNKVVYPPIAKRF